MFRVLLKTFSLFPKCIIFHHYIFKLYNKQWSKHVCIISDSCQTRQAPAIICQTNKCERPRGRFGSTRPKSPNSRTIQSRRENTPFWHSSQNSCTSSFASMPISSSFASGFYSRSRAFRPLADGSLLGPLGSSSPSRPSRRSTKTSSGTERTKR